ncbi:RAD50-interacting protein 1 [Planococcus citri]|uniref:RAD50-interacting protein 1 n=1 Tax=Planococcus citri TaxID=170843 RepID=UPI0031F8AFB0
MDMDKIYHRIDDFIGDDRKQISKCVEFYKILSKEKEELESKLNSIKTEVPAKITNSLAEIDDVRENISYFINELENSLEIYDAGEVENAFKKLQVFASKKQEYSKCLQYFKTLRFIETTSNEMKKSYSEANWSKCVTLYGQLYALVRAISSSECVHLLAYLKEMVTYWHKLIRQKLTIEYEQLLKSMNWPFVIRNKSLPSYPSEDLKSKFQQLTRFLLESELPEEMRPKPTVTSSLLIDFPTPSMPVSLLLEPLRKRFLFHFCGNKETNRPDKPEWMFSQILTWIKDHEIFFMEWVQPVYRGFTNSVKVEFTNGLIKLVTEKLHSDMMHLQYDDALFTHTLDETLGFHRELTENYSYPVSRASVLSVLTQAQVFVKWINMERKCAEKRMDDMLNSPTAWTIVTEDENCKVTECADKFVILLSTITDRYSPLPQPGHRMQFLDLQLDLIDEFRLRLVQLKRDDYTDVLSSDLPAILNTIHYLSSVLMEWSTNTHFILLHHFKMQTTADEDLIDASVFTEILALMNHFGEELIREICTSVTLEVSARSRPYRKDRWNIMPIMNPDTELSLTISGCAMFQTLTGKLHQMGNVIAPAIFKKCWRFVASQLCKLIIDDVILVNMFNKGGAQQLRFDVKRNILPLFAQLTPKPEAYFKPLIEACDLLCAESDVTEHNIPFDVFALSPSQVRAILDRKLDRKLVSSMD